MKNKFKDDHYEGPYRATHARTKAEVPLRPELGQLVVRYNIKGEPSGILFFRCPACMSVQIQPGAVSGPDDNPSVDREIACGCKSMCGARFGIHAGRAVFLVPPEAQHRTPKIPDRLAAAGVKPPPRLNCDEIPV